VNIFFTKIFSNGQQDVENIRRISFTSLKKYGFQIKQNSWKSIHYEYTSKSVSPLHNDLQTLLQ